MRVRPSDDSQRSSPTMQQDRVPQCSRLARGCSALPARYLLVLRRASAKEPLKAACIGYTRSHERQWLRITSAVWH